MLRLLLPQNTKRTTTMCLISARGAGLRAALGAPGARCESGSGMQIAPRQAHTVMAESGIAARWPMVTPRTLAHAFSRHQCASSTAHNWRMAHFTLRAPEPRGRELNIRGAFFDRTQYGQSCNGLSRFHLSPAVSFGHRTAGNDPYFARPREVQLGIDVYMEAPSPASERWRSRPWGIRFTGRTGRFVVSAVDVLATGGIGKAWENSSTRGSTPATGWRLASRRRARTHGYGVCQFFLPPHGLAAGSTGDSGYRVRPRRQEASRNKLGYPLSLSSTIPKDGALYS